MLNRLTKWLSPPDVINSEGPHRFNLRFLWFSLVVGTGSIFAGVIWIVSVESGEIAKKNLSLMLPLTLLIALSFFLIYRGEVRLPDFCFPGGSLFFFLLVPFNAAELLPVATWG